MGPCLSSVRVLLAGGDFVSIWLGGQQPQNQNGHPARNRRAMKPSGRRATRPVRRTGDVSNATRLLVCYRPLALQKRDSAGAGAAASWRLLGSVEHSFRCVLQLDSAKTEVPVGWQRCREEPICLRRNLAARKGARDTLTARSKTHSTPL